MAKKAFIVYWSDWPGTMVIHAVFSTREKAQDYIDNFENTFMKAELSIEEWGIDV